MTDNNRRIEYMAVSELMTRLHPQNPKEHDIPMIAQSFMDHGFVSSGTLDERTGLFLCGHGRTEALQYMIDEQMDVPRDINVSDGEWYCPVECGYSSLNDAQALAYIAIDNQATIAGDWDKEKLVAMLTEIKNSDEIELTASGFNEEQLKGIMTELANQKESPEEGEVPIDRAEELNEKWQVELGDIWEIPSVSGDGTHRIMCGDSTSAEDVELLMDGMKADAIVTDPPYGVGIDYKSIDDSVDEVREIIKRFMPIVFKYNCPTAITSGVRLLFDYPPPTWIMAWIHPAGSGRGPWGFTTFNPILIYGKDPYLANRLGSRSDSIVMTADRDGENIHPVTKPLNIWLWLIKRLSINSNDKILDFFLGSGTTIIASEETGRIGYGMELHPPFCAVSLERLSAIGLSPVRV